VRNVGSERGVRRGETRNLRNSEGKGELASVIMAGKSQSDIKKIRK